MAEHLTFINIFSAFLQHPKKLDLSDPPTKTRPDRRKFSGRRFRNRAGQTNRSKRGPGFKPGNFTKSRNCDFENSPKTHFERYSLFGKINFLVAVFMASQW